MLPPGLGFNAISAKALAASASARLPRAVLGLAADDQGQRRRFLPDHAGDQPAVRTARGGAHAEGGRARRTSSRATAFGEATRRAVAAWGLELLCARPEEYSSALTAVVMPDGHDADAFRKIVLERFDMSLGAGLGKLKGKVFRIGHLGDFNDLMLAGTLGGVEMGLAAAGVPFTRGGVTAALDYLAAPSVTQRLQPRIRTTCGLTALPIDRDDDICS